MKRHLLRSSILALAALGIGACSSTDHEATGSASSAEIAQSAEAVFGQAQITGAEALYQPLESTVTYTSTTPPAASSSCGLGGSTGGPGLVLTPSSALHAALNLGTQTVALPTISFDPSGVFGVCGTYNAVLSSFNIVTALPSDVPSSLVDVSATLTASGLSLTNLTFNASFAVSTGSLCPNFELNIAGGTLSTTLAWNDTLQEFQVGSLAANLPATVSNCIGGLCDQVIQGVLPDLNTLFEAQLTTDLNEVFSCPANQPSIASGLGAAITAGWNAEHPVASSTSGPWVRGTSNGAADPITYLPGAPGPGFETAVIEGSAPPPACSFGSTCHGEIQMQCTTDGATNPDPIVVYQLVNGQAQEVYVTPPPNPNLVPSTSLYAAFPPDANGAASGSFLACTQYDGGQTCDPTWASVTYTCTPPPCTPRTCSDGPFCGTLTDGCGGTLDCGGCSAGHYCDDNVCGTCSISSCGPGEMLNLAKCICEPQPKVCICGGVYPACQVCK